jgi:TorA maturation chaperone TorD
MAGSETPTLSAWLPDELARTAMERAKLYGLLANLFRREPGADLLTQLRSPGLHDLLSENGIDLGDDFFNDPLDDVRDRLMVEYTFLFLGPGKHISPHESVQLKRGSGILWGEETSIVRQFMAAAGFDLDESANDIPDHISVELEFLSHLSAKEAEAWQADDRAAAAAALGWQHRFVSNNIGKWVARFCRAVETAAQTPFYAEFAKLLRRFIAGEKSEILERLSNTDGKMTGP